MIAALAAMFETVALFAATWWQPLLLAALLCVLQCVLDARRP